MEHPLSGFSEHYGDISHLPVVLHVYTYSKWKQQAYLTDTCWDFWIKPPIVNVLRTIGRCFQFSLVLHQIICSQDQEEGQH